jgi:3-hydroxyisobutyrate dehydrogenase-like beta-hydroxyacid dehydrogenase
MAATVGRAGFPTIVWSRDRTKAERVADSTGARVADTAADAAAQADVVVSSLADDAAVRAVYLGLDGVVSGIRPTAIALDTSTISPETTLAVGAAVDGTGAGFLDCPVSGDVSRVEAGALTIMVGGDPELLERVRPVLDALAARIVHVGQRGAGSATKLAVNALVLGINHALSEAVVLAEKAGVDRAVAYEVFASGAGGAPFVHYKRAAFENPDGAPVAFSIDLVAKDLELITGLGRALGAPMPQAEVGLDVVRRAIDHGYGDRDLSAIAAFFREGAGG